MAAALLLSALLSTATFTGVVGDTVESQANPIGKVIQLLGDLDAKIVAEGKAAQTRYAEFSEFCEERAANLEYELKTAKGAKADLMAVIGEETARLGALDEKIAGLAADIATDNADLKAATAIRGKENADFVAEEKELMETIDTLERAVRILEKHASMVQIKNAGSISQALNLLVQASAISSADAKHLTALVQSSQESEDSDVGAPAGEVYVGHSGDIVETLQGILDKANDQLASSRNAETTNLHNFELMKQALEDEIKFGEKDMAKAKKNVAESTGTKVAAEGNLAQTEKLLGTDTTALDDLHHDCTSTAQNYEAEAKSRAEELNALRAASKVISESTGGAEGLSYGLTQVSFLQRTGLSTSADLAKFEAVHFVRNLAEQQHSPALAQLAVRMASALHAKMRAGEDPFAKIKDLIANMIEKLESEADADATHKAYCDKEIAETKVKHADKNAEINKISTKIDGMAARSAQLKAEVAALEKALAELAAAQAEMNRLRAEEKEAFTTGKADMEQGVDGVRLALKTLNDYYAKDDHAHAEAQGAGHGIIGLLEVVESDFSEGLVGMIATEEAAAAAYDKETKENEIEKTTNEQAVKYKTQEATDLDEAIAEASSDREGVQTELAAVMEYMKGLEAQCIEKAETFAERKRRFEAELAGLKEALKILSGEAVLLQKSQVTKRSLRAVRQHAM